MVQRFIDGAQAIYQRARPVGDVADAVWKGLTKDKPKARYVVSDDWFRSWFLPRLLPDRVLDRGVARRLGIKSVR